MREHLILGIDPGQSGGIALIAADKSFAEVRKVSDMTPRDIVNHLSLHKKAIGMAYLEQVSAMPKQGVSSTFKFGTNYGFYIGVLTALQIPFTYVRPQKWMKELNCMTGGNKNITKQKAQELFPDIKMTHAIADAILIAEYGRVVEGVIL